MTLSSLSGIAIGGALYSQTRIKHVNEIGAGQDIGDGSKGRELAQQVAGPAKAASGWTKPFERNFSKAAHDITTRAICANQIEWRKEDLLDV
jgi:hypothetical protein